MSERPRYAIYDTVQRKYLASFKKPVKSVDAAVTRWTERPEDAMVFKVLPAARSVATWTDGGVVLNERGERI